MVSEGEMNSTIRWTRKARNQWKNILRFCSERNGSDKYSLKLNANLMRVLDLLSSQTEMGAFTKRQGIRRHVVGNHVLFYRAGSGCLEIIAILDARREVSLD